MKKDVAFWKSITSNKLFSFIGEKENIDHTLSILAKLTFDPIWTPQIISQLERGKLETRCFVSWFAKTILPHSYLEIGVRRGFSMAMVTSRVPEVEIIGFDMWINNYGGVKNPGPKFVQTELRKIGYKKKITFISGDSHVTLPNYFRHSQEKPGNGLNKNTQYYDLITIDGDHSLLGAYQDLVDSMPYCSIGGAVIFDDIAPDFSKIEEENVRKERGHDPHGWNNLLGVWNEIKNKFPNFRYFEYTQNSPGVGVAIRID
jgi:predicted O-methyltransferase YrrM